MLTILIHCLWWFNHSLVMESWFQFSESKENVMWFHGLRRSGHSLLWAVWLLLCPRCVQEVCIRHWCIEFHDICIKHIIFFGCGLLWTLIRLDLFVATQTNNIVLLWVLVFDSVKLKWTRFGKTQIRYLRAYISDFMFAILNQCFFSRDVLILRSVIRHELRPSTLATQRQQVGIIKSIESIDNHWIRLLYVWDSMDSWAHFCILLYVW